MFEEQSIELLSVRANLISAQARLLGAREDLDFCEKALGALLDGFDAVGLIVTHTGPEAAVEQVLEVIAALEPLRAAVEDHLDPDQHFR
jgi:hypothetical protein